MGKSNSQVVGYRYYAKFAMFIGNRIEKLLAINFDNRKWVVHDPLKHPPNLLPVLEGNLFGENEGGVSGNIDIHFGYPDPEPNAEYQKYFPLVSGYPYQSYLVFRSLTGGAPSLGEGLSPGGFYLGNSGYMKEMLLWVKRIHVKNNGDEQWYDIRAEVPEGGGVEQPPITPETEPLDIPFGLKMANYLKIGDEIIANGLEDGNVVGKTLRFFGVGWSTSIDYDLESGILISSVGLPLSRWIGEIRIRARSKSVSPTVSITGATYSHNDGDGFQIYKIDFIGESLRIELSTSETLALQWSYLNLQKFAAPHPIVDSGDMNPIHKIREILTDDAAMGKPESDINNTNFMNAADRIWGEGLGISWSITEKSCMDAINELCYHIEAGIRVNRQTGLYEMVLFRDDWFEEDEVHTIAESKIKSIQYEITNADEVINQVNVNFYDRENIKNSSFSISENGLIQTLNRVNAETVDFPYFMNMRNAEIVANWKLKQLSTGAFKGSFTTGWREARKWNRYDLIRLPWSKRWTGTILVRIMSINLGGPTNNEVTIEFIEVVPATGMINTTIVADEPIDKPLPPQACQYEPFEMPYYLAVMALGQRRVDDELAYESNFGLVGVVAEQPQSNSLYAIMMTHDGVEGEEWSRAASINYDATADSDQIISRTAISFTVKNWKKIVNVPVGTLIQCGKEWLTGLTEWMVFQGVDPDTGVVSVKRGALDTQPQEWGPNLKLYFCGNDIAYDETEYVSGEKVLVSALTTTPSGVLELKGSNQVEMKARAIRPYMPANVRINGEYWPDDIETDLILTWVDRNRAQQTGGEILGWFDGGVTLESGVTYQLILIERDENKFVLRTQNLSGGTLNTYTFATSAMDANTRTIEIILKSLRDGYECIQPFEHIVELSQFFSAPYDITYTVSDI